MSSFQFAAPGGGVWTVTGPPGFTEAQARALFQRQSDLGALVGFKPGEVLSAATQAADGLASAAAQLAQAQSGLAGGLGAAAQSLAQAGGALAGSLAGTVPGLVSAVGPAVSGLASAAGPALSSLAGAAGSLASSATGLVGQAAAQLAPALGQVVGQATQLAGQLAPVAAQAAGQLIPVAQQAVGQLAPVFQQATGVATALATSTVQTLNRALSSTPVGAVIDEADFSKVPQALAPIAAMAVPAVTGVLATAKNLVGQATNVLSNSRGAGCYGFSAAQLETGGFLKPGMSALVNQGGATLASVCQSPAAWTGKEGVTNINSLLANPAAQDRLQQAAMATGLAKLSEAGVPVGALSAQGVAGLALNAAKSVEDTLNFVKNSPIVNDATGAIKAAFNQAVRDGAYAVNLVATKIPAAWAETAVPAPATDTTSRETVNAAANRVAGNPKIPPPNYGVEKPEYNAAQEIDLIKSRLAVTKEILTQGDATLKLIESKVQALSNQQTITKDQYDAITAEYQSARQAINDQLTSNPTYKSAISRATREVIQAIKSVNDEAVAQNKKLQSLNESIKDQLRTLVSKVEGTAT